jgi:hypothetical protein
MKEQTQTEQPDSYECKNKAACNQIKIAECKAQVNPSLVGWISLDEPRTIDFLGTFHPRSFDKDGYSALEPWKIAIFGTMAKAKMGQQEKQGNQTEY